MRITPEGRVGIGTTGPEDALDVAGAVRASGGFRFADGTTLQAGGGRLRLTGPEGEELPGASATGFGTTNKIAKWLDDTGTLGDSTFLEDASGNVFNFTGTRAVSGGAQPFFEVQRQSAGDILQRFWNTGAGGAKLRYVAGTGATSQIQLTDGAEWLSSIAGNNQIGLQFRVRATGSTNSEAALDTSARLTLARNGNVGVGVTNPASRLEVVGDVRLNGAGNGLVFPDGTKQTTAATGGGGGGGVPVGTVVAYAGPLNTIPAGWLVCDGAAVSRTQFAALFAAVGTSWGAGDSATTFNLPDLAGRFLRGVDRDTASTPTATPRDPDRDARAASNAGGNTGNSVGSLQADEFASHVHNAPDGLSFVLTKGSTPLPKTNVDTHSFIDSWPRSQSTASSGGGETRPKNAYVVWIIKAN
ncbi:MAG: phage tail protein [Acidobacteria bacterium]|nr:phage tail protein [Acidobacteriota bacterium]